MSDYKKQTFFDQMLAVLFGVIVLIMSVGVFFRYVMNESLYWSDEVVRYLFVWLTFLGAGVAVKDKIHLRVTVLKDHLSGLWQKRVNRFNEIIFIAFLVFLIIGGFIWVFEISGSYSSALGLPLNWFFYAALPVTSIVALFYAIRQFIE